MISSLRQKFIRRKSFTTLQKFYFSTFGLNTREAEPTLHDEYDLVVIGSGPSAIQCALDSSKRGKKVAIVDSNDMLGGICVHTGTLPSKTFREAVLHFTGYRHQGFYGKSYSIKSVTVTDILERVERVIQSEVDVIQSQLKRNGVHFVSGFAQFDSIHQVKVSPVPSQDDDNNDSSKQSDIMLKAKNFLVACGTRPAHNPDIPCDGNVVFDSDQILSGSVKDVPKSLIVVGAGVIGIEYASMINVLPGTNVTVIDSRPDILTFADKEIVDALLHNMRLNGARFLFGETIKSITHLDEGGVAAEMDSGKVVRGDALFYAVGRQANTAGLKLDKVGIEPNKRGLLIVNKKYQTSVVNIYATGDCIGPPSLASTSMEQGRLASCHMWNDYDQHNSQLDTYNYPYGIYTIPEISMVGKSEQQLTYEKRNFEIGKAKYEELAKGQMMGNHPGVLKILFDPNTLEVLGVHAIGEGATEIIHIGQVAIAMGCTLTFFRDNIFNYPTLAEAYRVAALNGLGRIGS